MSYKIIIFEGNELVGKSTLKKEYEKFSNFRHLCVDRMFITSLVYNLTKHRHNDIKDDIEVDLISFLRMYDPLFVYVKADLDIQLKRFDERGDWYIKRDELENLNNQYELIISKYIDMYPHNFLELKNNTHEQLEQNMIYIDNKISKMIRE